MKEAVTKVIDTLTQDLGLPEIFSCFHVSYWNWRSFELELVNTARLNSELLFFCFFLKDWLPYKGWRTQFGQLFTGPQE